MFVLVIVLLFIIIYVRVKNEEKHYLHFQCNQMGLYENYKRYRAVLETKRSSMYSTNWMGIILTEDAVVLQKTLTSGRYLVFRLEFSDIVSFRYRRVSNFKYRIKIRHHKDELPSPYELTILRRLRDEDLERLDYVRRSIADRVPNNIGAH